MLKIIIFVGALLVEEEIFPEIEDDPTTFVQESTSLSSEINNEYIFDVMGYIDFDDLNELVPPCKD